MKKILGYDFDNEWLGLERPDKYIYNPLDYVFQDPDPDVTMKRLFYIMSNPDYFRFATRFILNIDILPFQMVILKELWTKKYPMIIASRGASKSWTMSVYALLRALFLPKRKIIIVGSAFRQSKVLFSYMEEIWNNAPILRSLCTKESGPYKDPDRLIFRINNSTITCLPLGTGDKIRGARAHDIISDEFACLEAGSIVETMDGFVRIEDFDSHEIITGDEKCPVELPYKFIKTPLTDVYEIKLENGNVIRCSENHQVMTNKGWKKPKELNDSLFIEKSKHAVFSNTDPDGLTEDIAWLLGILVSEGSVVNKKQIHVTTTDINLCSKLVNKFSFKFSVKDAYTDERGWNCKKSYRLHLYDKDLRDKLFKLGLDYVTAHNKIVPKSILKSTKKTIISFLSGLFDGDGSCFLWQDKDTKNKIGLAYYSVSERLCRDIQFLSSKLGFNGYINKRNSNISENSQWFVRWNNNIAKNFALLLNIDRFKNTIHDCITTEDPSHITWDKNRNKWKICYLLTGEKIQKRFIKYEDAFNYVEHLKSLDNFRKIVSVQKLNNQQSLYDYYLPVTNSFYAEGFRQHNSIPIEIFETVVAGFANVSSSPNEKVKHKRRQKLGITPPEEEFNSMSVGNQIVLAGTAYYEFNHFAKYWKNYHSWISTKGDPGKISELLGDKDPSGFKCTDYSIIRIPVTTLPEGLMDDGMIARAKATVHAGIFDMEYGAIFSSDSQGFFKRTLIESCVVSHSNEVNLPSGPVLFEPALYGNKDCYYIYGIDPASEVDNFSIVVLEVHPDHRRIVYSWTTNRQQHKEKLNSKLTTETDFYSYCARKIRDLLKIFPCKEIAMDSQGGGRTIAEALHDKGRLAEGELPIWPVIDSEKPEDTDDYAGLHILKLCNFAKADWTAEANHGLRKDFEDKVLLFPYYDPVSMEMAIESDNINGRIYDTLEDCIFNIENLKNELSMINVIQTPSGRERWDTPEYIIGTGKKGRLRKDRYSALVMANMSARTKPKENFLDAYKQYGGFAQPIEREKLGKGDDYDAPEWFKSNGENNSGYYM
jgi:intein/homing endonuclease